MDSTGAILRRARNERHLTLDEVATRTRINSKYLAAIESGDTSSIPGGFFYKSFVRQYAAALSTEDDNILARVEQSLAVEQPLAPPQPDEEVLKALATKAEENAPSPSAGNRSAATYAVLLLFAMAGTTGVYMLWHRAQQAHASGEVARAMPQMPKKEETQPTPVAVSPQPSPAQTQPHVREPVAPAPAQPAPPPAPATAVSEPNADPPARGPDDKIALNVAAKEETWVSISADGKTLFSGVLAAGQSKVFGARENARMRIGNPGGLDVVFNGNPTGSLGSSRQPVTVLFSPSSFEIMKPKPPDPEPQQPD